MNILITGGAGFIGSHVADAYLAKGHRVIIVDNLSTGRRENVPTQAIFYHVDICDQDQLTQIFENESIDMINHHAAQMNVPLSVEDPVFDATVNVIGFLNLMQAAIKYNIQKVIFISSGGAIYGDCDTFPISEETPATPLSPYGITKYVAEKYLQFYARQYQLNYTVLRYANVYGPRQLPHGEAGVVAIFIQRLMAGQIPKIFAYPDQPDGMIRDYIYVDDVVQANLIALETGNSTAFNIGTGIETSTSQLLKTIQDLMGTTVVPEIGPARPGDLPKNVVSSQKAKWELDWHPKTTLVDGLRKTIDFFKN